METIMQGVNKPLSPMEARQAGESGAMLQALLSREVKNLQSTLQIRVEQPDGELLDLLLPGVALPLLSNILRELGSGKDIVVLATDTEITTQQAADFLKVSRPYLVKLLSAGKIPYRLVGPRRRVLLCDLLRYKEQEEAERHRGLDALAAESQHIGLS